MILQKKNTLFTLGRHWASIFDLWPYFYNMHMTPLLHPGQASLRHAGQSRWFLKQIYHPPHNWCFSGFHGNEYRCYVNTTSPEKHIEIDHEFNTCNYFLINIVNFNPLLTLVAIRATYTPDLNFGLNSSFDWLIHWPVRCLAWVSSGTSSRAWSARFPARPVDCLFGSTPSRYTCWAGLYTLLGNAPRGHSEGPWPEYTNIQNK